MAWNAFKHNGVNIIETDFAIDQAAFVPDQFNYVVVSEVVLNKNDAHNMDVVVDVLDIVTNDPAANWTDGEMYIVLEEETLPGKFATLAATEGRDVSKSKITGWEEFKLVIQKGSSADQGQPYDTSKGVKWYSSEDPSSTMRLSIICKAGDPQSGQFVTGIKLNASYRLY